MITFHEVFKKYPAGNSALDDINFHINEGEFVFLVGPSGAGKSTIIKLLIKDEVPTSGEIKFAGYDVGKIRKRGLPQLRREIGVVFQDFKLLDTKTVYENITFALEVAGKSNDQVLKGADYVLDLVGLNDKKNLFPYQISGGEKQRVAIARAMANNPHVLIADEPTGNLDVYTGWDIIQLLNKINNWGTTVVMATHAYDVVNSLQKRVIAMDKGKIVRDSIGGYNE